MTSVLLKKNNFHLLPYLGFEGKVRKAEIQELNSWNTDIINNPEEFPTDFEHFE